MKQQMYKVLSRLARRQHHKLGHVFIRVARTRSGRTRAPDAPGLAELEPQRNWPREGSYYPPFALHRNRDESHSCCE